MAGLLLAAVTVRLFAALLFGVGAGNVPTYAWSGAMLLAVGAFASYLPARRAMEVDAAIALRAE